MPTFFPLQKLYRFMNPQRLGAVVFDINTLISGYEFYKNMEASFYQYQRKQQRIRKDSFLKASEKKEKMETLRANYLKKNPWAAFNTACSKESSLDELHEIAEKTPGLKPIISSAKPVADIIKFGLDSQKNIGILQNINQIELLAPFLLMRHGLTEQEALAMPIFSNYDWFESKRNGLEKAEKYFGIKRKKDILLIDPDPEAIDDTAQPFVTRESVFSQPDDYSTLLMTEKNEDLERIRAFIECCTPASASDTNSYTNDQQLSFRRNSL